jgi:hypothetical protein
MKDYICIAALIVAIGAATMAITGCDVKQSQVSSGGPPVVVVTPATEPEPALPIEE